MASSPTPAGELYMSAAELSDEIVFQRTVLASIPADMPDREAVIKQVTKELNRYEQRLRDVKDKNRVQKASQSGIERSRTFEHSDTHGTPIREHAGSLIDPFDPFSPSWNNSTSKSAGSLHNPKIDLPSRKRHNGDISGLEVPCGNKSQRTSPSPGISRFGTPASGEEDADVKLARKRQEEAARRVQQEHQDAEYARTLQAQMAAERSPTLPQQTSSRVQSHSDLRNAFDRISGRQPFQSQPQSGPSSSQQRIKNETDSSNVLPDSQTPMPGTFPELDESDSDIELISADTFFQNARTSGSASGSRGSGSAPSAKAENPMKRISNSQGARLPDILGINTPPGVGLRTGYLQSGIHPTLGINGEVAAGAGSRPGYMQNGTPPAFASNQTYTSVYGNSLRLGGPSAPPLFSKLPGLSTPNKVTDYGVMDHNGNFIHPRPFGDDDDILTDPKETEQDLRELLQNISNDVDVPKENREGTPVGLKCPLYEHQKLALSWLKQMEVGTNRGGILADDMGLGKTISALALIHSRPSENRDRKTTLIVGPVALIQQWGREIRQKTTAREKLSTFIFHGGHRAGWETLRHYDVVLTTYGTLAHEFKKREAWVLKTRRHPNMDTSDEKSRFPFLGDNALWYRVILDEAQCIKNKNTKAAQGACFLKAQFRFCLTGTPMMNGVHELFSLIHFLRIKPYNDFKKFQAHFQPLSNKQTSKRTAKASMKKLQVLLKAIMLRRTKTSKIDGQPILNLPPKTEEIVHVLFNDDEQAFYSALEMRSKIQFNRYQKAGTVGKNYSNILVLLLRLRQAACHPHLIMDFEEAPPDISGNDMIELAKSLDPEVVRRLIEAGGQFECPICYDASTNPRIAIPCGHNTCSECLVKLSAAGQDIAIQEGVENDAAAKCPTCRGKIVLNKVIDYMSFKIAHMPQEVDLEDKQARLEDEFDTSDDSSSSCDDEDAADKEDDEDLADFVVPDNHVSEEEEGSVTADDELAGVSATRKFKGKQTMKDDDKDEYPSPNKKSSQPKRKEAAKDMETDDTDYDDHEEIPKKVNSRKKTKAKPKPKGKQRASEEHEDDDDEDDNVTLPDIDEIGFDNGERDINTYVARKAERSRKSKKSMSKKPKSKKDKLQQPSHHTLAVLKKEANKSAKNRKRYMQYLKANWISSAKTDKCMDILQNTAPGIKTIIFSQFTTLLDLVEIPVRRNFGKCYRRYDGSMSADARNRAVVDFTDKPDCTIMLVSLKAGNAGLNLVAASQVIILDPFWNPYIEMQAVDRAHRIGQQKPVRVHRILIKGTVEDRIMDLQKQKRTMIEAALDENASAGLARLGQAELAYLFNATGEERETANRGNPSTGPVGPGFPGLPSLSLPRIVGHGEALSNLINGYDGSSSPGDSSDTA